LAAGGPYLGQRPSVPEALDANAKPVLTMAEQKELEKLRAQDQREIKALRKELQRKEKAMAEMAALLVLQKKWDAFCSEDEEG
jgi:Skp family chaperone for outer membrane proteins